VHSHSWPHSSRRRNTFPAVDFVHCQVSWHVGESLAYCVQCTRLPTTCCLMHQCDSLSLFHYLLCVLLFLLIINIIIVGSFLFVVFTIQLSYCLTVSLQWVTSSVGIVILHYGIVLCEVLFCFIVKHIFVVLHCGIAAWEVNYPISMTCSKSCCVFIAFIVVVAVVILH